MTTPQIDAIGTSQATSYGTWETNRGSGKIKRRVRQSGLGAIPPYSVKWAGNTSAKLVDIKALNAKIAQIVARETELRAKVDTIVAELEADNE